MEEPTEEEGKGKIGEQVAGKVQGAYRWWDNLATLNAEDPLWLGGVKIFIRIIGILVLLAISPFALLAIIIGFLTVL